MKQLWSNIIGWINELGTPAVKLLVGGCFLIIVVLWLTFKDNYGDLKQQIHDLKKDNTELQRAKDTDHVIMQDKLDQCVQVQVKIYQTAIDKIDKVERKVKKIQIK